jgi:hypothetical protein
MNTLSHSHVLDTAQSKNSLSTSYSLSDSHFDDEIIDKSTVFDFDFDSVFPSVTGGEALDLIKGHLRTDLRTNVDPPYIAAFRGFSFLPVNGWRFPSSGFDHDQQWHYVAKVQNFVSGGYEVTITKQDLGALGRMMDSPRSTGARVQGEQNDNDVISSIQRSKKKVRHLIKSMGCDRMVTFTKRESEGSDYWTIERWAAAWKAFNKLCKRAGVVLQYVAVLERHKKGNYHLHAAVVGKVSVNLMRKMWLVQTGGKGSGNIDISMRRDCSEHKRRAGLAKYVSKYLTKQAGSVEFNKKRYWSSRHTLPPVMRYVFNTDDLGSAFNEIVGLKGLDIIEVANNMFIFPSGGGIWFSYDDAFLLPVPF